MFTRCLYINPASSFSPSNLLQSVANRLLWIAENAEIQEIKIIVFKNEGFAEGEESFEVVLSSPTPTSSCQLGRIWKTTIKIAAKGEDVNIGGTKTIARIKVWVQKNTADLQNEPVMEEMKSSFVRATSKVLGIPHNRLFLSGNSITPVSDNILNLQFDLLPSTANDAKSVHKLAEEFINAVGDPNSGLYSGKLK